MDMMKERRILSVELVAALTLAALLLGWAYKASLVSAVSPVFLNGVTADLPDNWILDNAAGDQLVLGSTSAQESIDRVFIGGDHYSDPNKVFTSWDPLLPGVRYSVSKIPISPDGQLAEAASIRNLQRAQTLSSYRILEQTPVTLHGREGYKVAFAFVDARKMDAAPRVVHGVDYYFLDGETVLVAALETSGDLQEALPAFQWFAVSVGLGE